MTKDHGSYVNPLIERYASKKMSQIFSSDKKFSTWRKLWVALAKAEKDLGLEITDEQIEELSEHIDDIDYEKAAAYEADLRHDVMAHIHTYGDAAPTAAGIIHLGATSAFVGDNADLIIYHEALTLIGSELVSVIEALSSFADKTKGIACLGYTHLQPAQLTTVGKRACLWLTDLMLDFEELSFVLSSFRLRGAKGTTGTQASFMELFDGDEDKVKALNSSVLSIMGFEHDFPLTGQTYPRKFDSRILNVLSSISQSLHKFATDLRLLQSFKELEEPFGSSQVGSSAMPYKRNPMKAERICSLSRYVISLSLNPQLTASVQWFERTLDDSANRRISIPEAFLAVDATLSLALSIIQGIEVNEKVIEARVLSELPFMTTENLLMQAVKNGGDRQVLHEKLRLYAMDASYAVKKEGNPNPFLDLVASDEAFKLSPDEIEKIMDPSRYIGRSVSLVEEYLKEYVLPLLASFDQKEEFNPEIKV